MRLLIPENLALLPQKNNMSNKDTSKDAKTCTSLRWTTGLVAFIDILGYKKFAQIRIESIVEEIVGALTETPKIAQACYKDAVQEISGRHSSKGSATKIVSSFKTMVLSDSIIISCPCPFSENDQAKSVDFARIRTLFISYCRVLAKLLMTRNLLVRGAITYGKYLRKDNTLAGIPLIEAYELSEEIDAACLVLSPTLEHLCSNSESSRPDCPISMCNKIQVPLKKSGNIFLYVVNATPAGIIDDNACAAATDEQLKARLEKVLYTTFTAYHKTLPIDVYRKYANTVRIFNEILGFEKQQQAERGKWKKHLAVEHQPRITSHFSL